MTLPRSDWNVESPFMLIVGLELGDRVAWEFSGQNSSFGWAGRLRAYEGRPTLRRLAEHDWRGWWRTHAQHGLRWWENA